MTTNPSTIEGDTPWAIRALTLALALVALVFATWDLHGTITARPAFWQCRDGRSECLGLTFAVSHVRLEDARGDQVLTPFGPYNVDAWEEPPPDDWRAAWTLSLRAVLVAPGHLRVEAWQSSALRPIKAGVGAVVSVVWLLWLRRRWLRHG